MHSTFQPVHVRHMPYYPYSCGSQMPVQSPPSDYFVLDLSTKSKRVASPDYTYCYPSPKSSPHSDPSNYECESAKCCLPQISTLDQAEVKSRLQSPSYITSSANNNNNVVDQASTLCYPLPSPRSPKSPGAISETTSETSFHSDTTESRSPQCRRKMARPFKILAKDSVALSIGVIDQLDSTYSASSFIIDDNDLGPEATKMLMEESAKKYSEFREKMLMQLRNNNNTTNQNMRRMQNNGHRVHDPEYQEKRRKNNEAAKKSRDARRYKQDEIAIRATFLEQENIMLKYKVQSEIDDLERLRKMELERNSHISC